MQWSQGEVQRINRKWNFAWLATIDWARLLSKQVCRHMHETQTQTQYECAKSHRLLVGVFLLLTHARIASVLTLCARGVK